MARKIKDLRGFALSDLLFERIEKPKVLTLHDDGVAAELAAARPLLSIAISDAERYAAAGVLLRVGAGGNPQVSPFVDSVRQQQILGAQQALMAMKPIGFRQSGCDLQISVDGGATWSTIYTDCTGSGGLYVLRNPAASENIITPLDDQIGLFINSAPGSTALYVLLNDASANSGIEIVSTVDVPAIGVSGPIPLSIGGNYVFQGDGTNLPIVHGADLALISANERAFYIRRTSGQDDRMHLIGRNASGALAVLDFAAGPTGAAGAGITSAAVSIISNPLLGPSVGLTLAPDIQHQLLSIGIPRNPMIAETAAISLLDTDPPAAVLMTRPDGDQKIIFGIPAGVAGATGPTGPAGPTGPTGPAGSAATFPSFPVSGSGATVTFTMMIPTAGCALPWVMNPGTRLQLSNWRGIWICPFELGLYYTTAAGSNTVDSMGYPVGRALFNFEPIASSSLQLTPYATQDALALDVIIPDWLCGYIYANAEVPGTGLGYLFVDVTLISPLNRRARVGTSVDYGSGMIFGDWAWIPQGIGVELIASPSVANLGGRYVARLQFEGSDYCIHVDWTQSGATNIAYSWYDCSLANHASAPSAMQDMATSFEISSDTPFTASFIVST